MKFKKSSSLKILSQSQLNFAEMILRWSTVQIWALSGLIKVITKLPNSEQSYKGKVQTHNYINRQSNFVITFIKPESAQI
jgi:hypothetical protein